MTLTIDGRRVKVQVWDTAGQERFRNITVGYYRKAQGTLLVYDVTNRGSFESVDHWMNTIRQHAGDSIIKVLVGNKMDCDAQRVVQKSEGEALSHKYGILFFETSAKTQQNVQECFTACATECYKKQLSDTAQVSSTGGAGTVRVSAQSSKAEKKKCC